MSISASHFSNFNVRLPKLEPSPNKAPDVNPSDKGPAKGGSRIGETPKEPTKPSFKRFD